MRVSTLRRLALRGLIAVPLRAAFVPILAALAAAAPLAAQDPGRAPVAEFRATLPINDWEAFELGTGLNVRAGWYVRLSAAALGGAIQLDDGSLLGTARAEAAMRFHLDPFSQGPGCGARTDGVCRGLYGGLGVSQRWLGSGIGAQAPVFVLLAGIELNADPKSSPLVWSIEAALGGGLRIGAAARWRRADGYR